MSEHFSITELTASATAKKLKISNVPDPKALANLERLMDTMLEPLRALWGCPVSVTSGYRSPALNLCVGGVKSSAHMDGRAADLVPQMGLQAAYDMAIHSDLPYDQCIIEQMGNGAKWLHVSIARDGETPRREALKASDKGGRVQYQRISTG